MRNIKPLFILFVAAFVLASCNGDDDGTPSRTGSNNANANKPSVPYSTRLEIPRLKDEGSNLFLVKHALLSDQGTEKFVNFCVEYDMTKKAPRWTAFRWDIDNSVDNNVGRTGDFAEDADIPYGYRTTLSDHSNNGYDRGHMLASEDRQCSRDANSQTFLLSNMQPQYRRFNGSEKGVDYVWLNLEVRLRKLYSGWTRKYNATDTLYVVKGGTVDNTKYNPTQTLNTAKGLIVPNYFYVALLYKQGKADYKSIAFWVKHTDGLDTTKDNDLKRYCISIDELEQKTGIDFFCNLPDNVEDEVEKKCVPAAWGFK